MAKRAEAASRSGEKRDKSAERGGAGHALALLQSSGAGEGEGQDDLRSFSGAGASSPAALTPDIPKADAPARRRSGDDDEGEERDGSGAAARGARAAAPTPLLPPPPTLLPPFQSPRASPTCALGATRCSRGIAHARETAAAAAKMLWTPAAPSVWPKRDLAAASASGSLSLLSFFPSSSFASPLLPSAPERPPTSMGSPRGVPVPWRATRETPARASEAANDAEEEEEEEEAAAAASEAAERSSAACAGPLGAVRLDDRPSWLTAEPTSTARGESEEAEEGSRRESRSIPQPSPRPYPSDAASSALVLPAADSAPSAAILLPVSGSSIRLTPPASDAGPVSRARRAREARCAASSEEEQAVSSATHAPRSASEYERRPAMKCSPEPVSAAAVSAAAPRRVWSRVAYSCQTQPT